jgi:glycosyltransferase involved in cell wall biosynthesis
MSVSSLEETRTKIVSNKCWQQPTPNARQGFLESFHYRNWSFTLKIDIVVHGRFYAFDLARELINLDHDVVVYTNYPKIIAKRFGVPPGNVKSFTAHGIMTRLHRRLDPQGRVLDLESYFHRKFGSWAAEQIRLNADLVYCFSGVAEEILRLPRGNHSSARWLTRASTHIQVQSRLLADEEGRLGVRVDKPSIWMMDRERREYALADKIVVLSSFARRSFIEEGFGDDRLILLRPGVEKGHFGATAKAITARCKRIENGQPLRVLTVGSFTARKGGLDLLRIAEALAQSFRFEFVGDDAGELDAPRRSHNQGDIVFHKRAPQATLIDIYDRADLFVFPTIEDGAPAVLDQALAAGLPILTTTNCSGPDLIEEGITGWILPIRSADAFIQRLRWCDRHRYELAAMIANAFESFAPRDWSDTALDFVRAVHEKA